MSAPTPGARRSSLASRSARSSGRTASRACNTMPSRSPRTRRCRKRCAFGQSPTNYAIERAIEQVARHRGLDRLEVRRRNLIRADEFPYLIPSGTTYDSGDYHAVVDKVVARGDYAALVAERARLRAQGLLAGIGMAACLEPSGANSTFEPLLNPKNETTTYSDSCRINVDVSGA